MMYYIYYIYDFRFSVYTWHFDKWLTFIYLGSKLCINVDFSIWLTAAVAQGVRALAPQEEGWMFESQSRQTLVVNTGSDHSTAKCSAIGVNVTGPRR